MLVDEVVDDLAAGSACGCIPRQKHVAGGEAAVFGERFAELVADHALQQLVGQAGQDTCAVSGVGLRAAGAAVVHAAQQMIRVANDLMAALTLDVCDEADATAVVLKFGPVEPCRLRSSRTRPGPFRHISQPR